MVGAFQQAVLLLGVLGCGCSQIHIRQEVVAQQVEALHRGESVRLVATNGSTVRVNGRQSATVDQNTIGQSPIQASVAELIEGCTLPAVLERNGYALRLTGEPCHLAEAQFLTLGRARTRTPRRSRGMSKVGRNILFWVVFGVTSLIVGLVRL